MDGQIPLWPKLAYTAMVAVIVPVYWVKYGPANFLWFSDIVLLMTAVALWFRSPLLASMMLLCLLPEVAWNVDFFIGLVIGKSPMGMSAYMFEPARPLYLRGLSLFHVVLPPVLIWLVHRLGYDRRALLAQTLVALAVLPISYFFTDPAENINWVHGPGSTPQTWMRPIVYLLLLMVLVPAGAYLPVHWIARKAFRAAGRSR